MPAPRAARTPRSESSTTTHASGATPSRLAASRNTSGAGLPRATSTPDTVVWNSGRTPSAMSVMSITAGDDDDATARRTPRAASARGTSGTPGIGVTRSRSTGSTRSV